MLVLISGGSSRSAFRFTRVPHSRSVKSMAIAKKTSPCPLPITVRGRGPLTVGCIALDRQLRSPVRIHIRFLPIVRPVAFRLFRPVRPSEKDNPAVGLPFECFAPVHYARGAVLRHTRVRLRNLLVLHLHPLHERLLRFAEHRLQTRRSRGMTKK